MKLGIKNKLMIGVTALAFVSSSFAYDRTQTDDGIDSLLVKVGLHYDSESQYLFSRGEFWLGVYNTDYAKANEWFLLSADKGHGKAMLRLGDAYYFGLGVRHDLNTAMKWYEAAADKKEPEAQYSLGRLYEDGKVYDLAQEWYGKSCDNGNQKGCGAYRELNSI